VSGHKKRKKISVKPQGALNSDINITPMVDVVLVLLIIFMVVTPLLEKDIEVKVPESEKVEQQDELPQDQLVVTVAESGEVKINLDVVATQADYVEKLSRMLAAKKKGEKLVFFTADDKTNYAKLVAALDGARQAGAETLGMATDKIEAAPAPAPVPEAP
jgi:biopolymer transport protein ExbD/biopolymer transport protein TolR